MRQFSPVAQLYIWAVVVCGFAALLFTAVTAVLMGEHQSRLLILILGCVAGFIASFLKVGLRVPGRRQRDSVSNPAISLGFLPSFFLLFGYGPLPAMLASVINVLVMTLYPRRSPYFQVLFSLGAIILSVAAAEAALVGFGVTPDDWQHFNLATYEPQRIFTMAVAVLFATASYAILNTFLISTAIAMTSGKRVLEVWNAHYRWLMSSYFAGASCTAIAFTILPFLADHIWICCGAMVVGVPILDVIYQAYRNHVEQEEANLRHIEELERKNAELEASRSALAQSKDDLERLYTSTVESLALAIDAKDRYTNEHIQRVKEMAVRIGLQMGLDGDDMRALETGALLHDIGKLAIPEHILSKPGRLTDEEFEKIKAHPDLGAKILEPVPFPFPVLPIVRGHHERWDGKGYPDGLAGEAIPLGARILAVADVYDALTSDRSYRTGWSPQKAISHIQECAGTHFDPRIVDAFSVVAATYLKGGMVGDSPLPALPDSEKPADPVATIRADVREEINRASFEYLSLYEISQAASATLDLNETLSLLANKLRLLFSASACTIQLSEPSTGSESQLLYCRAANGVAETVFSQSAVRAEIRSAADGATEPVSRLRQGMIGLFDPADLVFETAPTVAALNQLRQLRVSMIVPFTIDSANAVRGAIHLYHERPGAFDVEDLRVLQTVSLHVARAIGNALAFDQTHQSAITDALTGLYNARHLGQFLQRELQERETDGLPLTVLVLDLDGFKQVNDRFGHARGNVVLRDLGNAFQAEVRQGDLVARYAGDEFVVVLPGLNRKAARVIAERLRRVVERYEGRPMEIDGKPAGTPDEDPLGGIRVGISIGAATFPQDATNAAALIAKADRDMYRDKNSRREAEEKTVRYLLANLDLP